jgi:rare lipoprotein A (peptidoglycan hydrolase)
VSPAAAKRTVVLAGVALVAALVSLALGSPRRDHDKSSLPQPASTWYTARAAPYNPARSRTRTACGQRLNAKTLGVAHPVLPCGVKIYISYRGTKVLTQVIDRGLNAPGREFYVTKALADRIGLHGTRSLRWTYAR